MVEVHLMHAGEEGLFVLIPVAVVLLVDYRKRRREKQQAATAAGPSAEKAPETEPGPD